MILLALDLSSNCTGWCIMDNNTTLISFGQVDLSKHKKKKFPLEYIKVLYEEIQKIIIKYKPDFCIIEDTYARNISTIKSLCRIRGIAESSLINSGIYNIFLMNAKSARKNAFGNGNLKSEECYELLKNIYPNQEKEFFTKGYDIVDAIVLGIAGIKKGAD